MNARLSYHSLLIIIVFLFFACANKEKEKLHDNAIALKYAQGFSVRQEGKIKYVTVHHPYQGATTGYTYILVPQEESISVRDEKIQVIKVPVKNIVCTSTTHIPLLDYLNESDKLIGFPNTDFICSQKVRKRIDDGKVTELGMNKEMNLELLFTLKPSLVMGYTMNKDLGQLKKIPELGIPTVINAEYLENHPLGRAEWIKFMALFFDKEKEADSVFNFIEKEYLQTQTLAQQAKTKPTVMSGIVYGDAWFMPGGQNYAARLLKDSACDYLWANDSTSGYLELSFESVFSKAKEADFWIGVGSFNSLNEMQSTDYRYSKFKSFRQKNVFSYNAKQGANGGNEFLELGYLRPDIILKDLVKIAHPEKLTDYELYFYKKIE